MEASEAVSSLATILREISIELSQEGKIALRSSKKNSEETLQPELPVDSTQQEEQQTVARDDAIAEETTEETTPSQGEVWHEDSTVWRPDSDVDPSYGGKETLSYQAESGRRLCLPEEVVVQEGIADTAENAGPTQRPALSIKTSGRKPEEISKGGLRKSSLPDEANPREDSRSVSPNGEGCRRVKTKTRTTERQASPEVEEAKLITFLQSSGFDDLHSSRTRRGQSYYPLHSAVSDNNVEIVRLLLKAKALPTATNSAGQTPYQLADQLADGSHGGFVEILKLLGPARRNAAVLSPHGRLSGMRW